MNRLVAIAALLVAAGACAEPSQFAANCAVEGGVRGLVGHQRVCLTEFEVIQDARDGCVSSGGVEVWFSISETACVKRGFETVEVEA